jgi:diguanylate cyclase (GGDEF)-like protein
MEAPIVASRQSGDAPDTTNGTIPRQRETSTAALSRPGDEQPLADSEQMLGDRLQTATLRLTSAHERDATARARDLDGWARDRAAAARDLAMAQRDGQDDHDAPRAVTGAQIVMRAAEQRRRAAEYRALAVEHRRQAALDREAAAADRAQGARDRVQTLADCHTLANALATAETDPLTGARSRAAGLADLDREVNRCHRLASPLVAAHIDAVGLRRVNDSDGYDAGDRLLKRVVALIGEHLRSYDLIIRVGGDEFLCAIANMTLDDARERFSAIASALAGSNEAGAIRFGFAALLPDETATDLIARADRELTAGRHD